MAASTEFYRNGFQSGSLNIQHAFRNNAQEMSPLDEGFRSRIDVLYPRWRRTRP